MSNLSENTHPIAFAVVYFKEDGTYSEIPVGWLSDNKQKCWWPKARSALAFMQKLVMPDGDDTKWEQFDIRVEAYCSTLERARKKAELGAEYSSGEDNLQNRGRGKRQKFPKQKIVSEGSSSEGSDITLTPPPSLNVSVEVEVTPQPSLDTDTVTYTESTPLPINITEIPVVMVKDDISLTHVYMALVELTKICLTNQEHIKSVERMLKNESEPSELFSKVFQELESQLPLQTAEDALKFDEKIRENQDFRNTFTKYIKKIGGEDPKNAVNRALKTIFTNEFGINCTWYGRSEKFAVQSLLSIKIIADVIIMKHDTTMSSIQKITSEWFRLSKQRTQRETKKTNSIDMAGFK